MERGPIVKSFACQGLKVFDRFGSDVRPKLNDHFSFARLDQSHFTHICPLIYSFAESAGTILMLLISTRLVGLLISPRLLVTGVFAIFSRTSIPFVTLPKAVYCLSSDPASP